MPNEWIMFIVHYLYQPTVKCSDSKKRHNGICETIFKKCYENLKKSFNLIKCKNDSSLFIEYWTFKQKQQARRALWEIKGQCKTYNSNLKKTNLCLNEKLAIVEI